MTRAQTQEQTPQHQMMTVKTSLLSPVNNLHLCSTQTSNRTRLSRTVCLLMCGHVVELEALFEDHGVCSGDIADSLALERVLYEQRALAQPFPSALLLVNRHKGVHFLSDLVVAHAFLLHTSRGYSPNPRPDTLVVWQRLWRH